MHKFDSATEQFTTYETNPFSHTHVVYQDTTGAIWIVGQSQKGCIASILVRSDSLSITPTGPRMCMV